MANDVKWIKITTDIFDDEKILLIESMPNAYPIIVCWFKLLCLAGKQNNGGVFMMNDKIAYTDKMLATIFRMKESTVKLAIKTFQQFGMIEISNGIIAIPNWNKHQSLDALEKKRAYQKDLMRRKREAQFQACEANCEANKDTNCEANCEANVSSLEEERDKEGELDKEFTPPTVVVNSGACARDGGGEKPDFDTLEAYASANLQCLTSGNMAELVSFKADLPEDVIRFAIDAANANGVRKWAYVRSILQCWVEAGIKTLGDAKAEAETKRGKKAEHARFDYQQRDYSAEDFSRERFNDLERFYGDGGADDASG